jgi:NAD+ kinase
MRVSVAGKHREDNRRIERLLVRHGFQISRKSPDIVVCNGGDGTLLHNERRYPGVPKVLVRGKHICRTCHDLTIHEMAMRLSRGHYSIREYDKLETAISGIKLSCANDFVIRNRHPSRALRFTVSVDGKRQEGIIIGDGAVISTPFGSTGYFSSITRQSFSSGIGIAFNNTVEAIPPRVIPIGSKVKVTAVRESADLSCDNMARTFTLRSGKSITVRASKEKLRIVVFRR